MAEGARLESEFTCKRNKGSNPFLSAKYKNARSCAGLFCIWVNERTYLSEALNCNNARKPFLLLARIV